MDEKSDTLFAVNAKRHSSSRTRIADAERKAGDPQIQKTFSANEEITTCLKAAARAALVPCIH